MPKFKCEGYVDVRINVSVEIEADTDDEAHAEAESRFDSRDDIEEDETCQDVVETLVTKVERIEE